MIKYPNGKTNSSLPNTKKSAPRAKFSCANRGMSLEDDINKSNLYYKSIKRAYILKRPTPIHIVKVDYASLRIKDAYFEQKSTTDYNGIYRSKYIDFEAKSTLSKTSFPLSNIHPHQIEHLKNIHEAKGIAFYIVYFQKLNKYFLLDSLDVIEFFNDKKRKSIPLDFFLTHCLEIKESYKPRLNYLDAVDKLYF